MRPVPRFLVAAAACAAITLGAVGCSSGDSSSAPTTTAAPPATTATGHTHSADPMSELSSSHTPDTTPGACPMHEISDVLSESEAVVHFSPQQICPGYVTVLPGTKVSWVNDDKTAHSVTISEPAGTKETTVATQEIPPGGTWKRPFADSGVFAYRTDAIDSFRGTVEVLSADGSSTHGH